MNVGSFILVHTGKFPLWACSKIRSAVRWMQFTVRRGKERRGRRVLLAESCQRELWDGVWSSRWCSAQTQFKTWLTLASGRTVLSVSHLRVGERRRGSARLIWVKCILIERERGGRPTLTTIRVLCLWTSVNVQWFSREVFMIGLRWWAGVGRWRRWRSVEQRGQGVWVITYSILHENRTICHCHKQTHWDVDKVRRNHMVKRGGHQQLSW